MNMTTHVLVVSLVKKVGGQKLQFFDTQLPISNREDMML